MEPASEAASLGPALHFSVHNTNLSFHARLLLAKNPDLCAQIIEALSLKTFLGHVVVAGETLWMPTKIVHYGTANMVERVKGSVYFYGPGTQINVCWGEVTETNPVNQFAQVYDEDLFALREVGKLAEEQTFTKDTPFVVSMTVSLISNGFVPGPMARRPEVRPLGQELWEIIADELNRAVEDNLYEEPDDVRNLRLGVIESGAGTRRQSFSVLVHAKAYTMVYGADMIYRILLMANSGALSLEGLKSVTLAFFCDTFNHFKFMGDLGLKSLASLGLRYIEGLRQVPRVEDFIKLTEPLLLFVNLIHRWVHNVFPWHHGSEYPHQRAEDVARVPKLATYGGH